MHKKVTHPEAKTQITNLKRQAKNLNRHCPKEDPKMTIGK